MEEKLPTVGHGVSSILGCNCGIWTSNSLLDVIPDSSEFRRGIRLSSAGNRADWLADRDVSGRWWLYMACLHCSMTSRREPEPVSVPVPNAVSISN